MDKQTIRIQYKLKKKGFKQKDLAKILGVSDGAISHILRKQKKSLKIEQFIEKITGEKLYKDEKIKRRTA